MAQDEDGAGESTADPSFNNPKDPRWSQNPHVAPARNPYLEMPLDAPPIGGAPHGSGYPMAAPGNGGGAGERNHAGDPRRYQQPGYPLQERQPSGVLAIVSVVAGIIGVFTAGLLVVPEIVAIICGHLALKREPHMRGVAIGGLVTGYLGLLVVVLIAGLLVWGFFATVGSY
ncbi:DUF4190 domain-containing protein [Paeniglutamicibacter terrestris]|uniref:DUF4190 domain-containing protein n=1 Tax=Paeniglutamicibacter terrestris TaxID=2723403 RepID=A0ABX1GB09_9MICC|nr:DUF4190 domain-containing protein [Paeniglutamicibacter terrestris]NKG22766.1 DUF4190 domain-containing protein [Paeniglutamicibacter terrestris]